MSLLASKKKYLDGSIGKPQFVFVYIYLGQLFIGGQKKEIPFPKKALNGLNHAKHGVSL